MHHLGVGMEDCCLENNSFSVEHYGSEISTFRRSYYVPKRASKTSSVKEWILHPEFFWNIDCLITKKEQASSRCTLALDQATNSIRSSAWGKLILLGNLS